MSDKIQFVEAAQATVRMLVVRRVRDCALAADERGETRIELTLRLTKPSIWLISYSPFCYLAGQIPVCPRSSAANTNRYRVSELQRRNQNLSNLLTIRALFVSYAAQINSIRHFVIYPAFSNLFLS
jgi:hypothetical protein